MTEIEFNYWCLDKLLRTFNSSPTGTIEKWIVYSVTPGESLPPDYDKVLALLISEGYLEEDERSFTITYKGRSKLNEGGFLGEYRRQMRNRILERIGIIVGIITGIAGLVCSILALI